MQFVKLGSLATAAALLAAMATPALADTTFPTVTQTAADANDITNAQTNTTKIRDNAGNGAAGAIGLNSTAGDANQQTNQIILQTSATANASGPTNGVVQATQTIGGIPSPYNPNPGNSVNDSAPASASVGDTTALGASGNVGANAAAGELNQQANVLVLSNKPNNGGTLSYSAAVAETAQDSFLNQAQQGANSTATIDGSAAQNASGNIGLNSAAGAYNQQANVLYAATASTGSIPNRSNAGTTDSGSFPGQENQANVNIQAFSNSTAGIADNAGQGARGNTAMNAAAGLGNQQSNTIILITGISGGIPPSTPGAGSRNFQEVYGSIAETALNSRASTIGGNAASGASGAISLNSAAGIQNLQSNATIVLQGTTPGTPSSRLCNQCGGEEQVNGGLTNFDFAPSSNTSTLGGSAASGLTGLAAINNATGNFNEQANLQNAFTGSGVVTAAAQGVYQVQRGDRSDTGPLVDSAFDFATVTGNAGSNVKGALNANVVSGDENQQMNQLIAVTGDRPFAAQSAYVQQYQQNFNPSTGTFASQSVVLNGAPQTATVDGSAFSGGTGVIDANVGAGDLNQQGNVVLLLSSSLTSITPAGLQVAPNINVTNTGSNPGAYTAAVGGSALSNSTGAMNLNVTAGVGNQQGNIMQLAR